jgi:hypothetical protein
MAEVCCWGLGFGAFLLLDPMMELTRPDIKPPPDGLLLEDAYVFFSIIIIINQKLLKFY